MVIKNRLFPYPVLAEDTDDYREGSFIVNPSVIGESLIDIDLHFQIELDNGGIKHYIDSDKAYFAIHIECSKTSYRDVIVTKSDEAKYHLSKSAVNGNVNLLGMVIAKEDIPYYKNIALDRDYDDTDIFLEKGSIMAYYNMPKLVIYKQYEDLSTSENIFVLCKQERQTDQEHNPITFNIHDHKIKIYVDDDVFNSYIKIKDQDSMKSLIATSLIYPALIYVLEELECCGDIEETFQEYTWYKQISDYFKKNDMNLIDVVQEHEKPFTILAQELLNKPINTLFSGLIDIQEGEQ